MTLLGCFSNLVFRAFISQFSCRGPGGHGKPARAGPASASPRAGSGRPFAHSVLAGSGGRVHFAVGYGVARQAGASGSELNAETVLQSSVVAVLS